MLTTTYFLVSFSFYSLQTSKGLWLKRCTWDRVLLPTPWERCPWASSWPLPARPPHSPPATPRRGIDRGLARNDIIEVWRGMTVARQRRHLQSSYTKSNVRRAMLLTNSGRIFKEILRKNLSLTWGKCPWLLLFEYWTERSDLSSSFCTYYVYL